MNYKILNKPNFKYEAVSCITEYYNNNSGELIKNHDNFKISEDEMKYFLKDYLLYKETLTEEILPLYNQYPNLDKIFKLEFADDISSSPIIQPLIIDFKDLVYDKNNLSVIDKKLNNFLENYVPHLVDNKETKSLSINSFDDLLKELNSISLEGSQKMMLIDLYYNRYEIIRDFLEFVDLASKICEKHFNIIEKTFNETYEHLMSFENLEEYISKAVGVHFKIVPDTEFFISILQLNSFSFYDISCIFLGILFFKLVDLKTKNKSDLLELATELKALADPTRLKIMSLLSKENLYIQEMSEMLDLTPATISHHVSLLLKHNFISIHIDAEKSKKIFYTTNPSKLNSLGDIIKDLSNFNL